MLSSSDQRFEFGKNWTHFLQGMNEDRIQEAIHSLVSKLDMTDFSGKTFLDIGSGSGLFSLAAHRLGAHVISFDYDRACVVCTQHLKEKYANTEIPWSIIQGSVLDQHFLDTLPRADIVYSWGVLHHTGAMMQAFNNIISLVKPQGKLFISIYNDQGGTSRRWHWIKKTYVAHPYLRLPLEIVCGVWLWKSFIICGIRQHPLDPFKLFRDYGNNNRGMSIRNDLKDWVGGYPFEVATPEVVFNFFKPYGFTLTHLKTCAGGIGCNEFVFTRP
jgi:2-polyprenyl-3-methyl-5-hydroxy-6-metoxy-1,4-benzoquinol methylase